MPAWVQEVQPSLHVVEAHAADFVFGVSLSGNAVFDLKVYVSIGCSFKAQVQPSFFGVFDVAVLKAVFYEWNEQHWGNLKVFVHIVHCHADVHHAFVFQFLQVDVVFDIVDLLGQ